MKRTPQARIIRRALGLSQEDFAARYHIPLGTLRDWEQGRAEPDQAARAYLRVGSPTRSARRSNHHDDIAPASLDQLARTREFACTLLAASLWMLAVPSSIAAIPRVPIAKAAIAGDHSRPALLDRAITAIPDHASCADRNDRAPRAVPISAAGCNIGIQRRHPGGRRKHQSCDGFHGPLTLQNSRECNIPVRRPLP